MKQNQLSILVLLLSSFCFSCGNHTEASLKTIDKAVLKDKIAGGWAGKMIGVTYGAPTEFKAQGTTYEEPIAWKPSDVVGSMWQDDIYVQLTLMETMDKYGLNAPTKKYLELFAKAEYPLWHANMQARKNYFDSIFPPQSGEPRYNLHADDIDFQIEADYIGFICPGMPNSAAAMGDSIGHIMNYGEGVYGGIFVAALYAEAYFQTDIPSIIDKALLSLPTQSDYTRIVKDVIKLHKQYPEDWRLAWAELEKKWGKVNICEAGKTFNIDAKLNGAYIVMGLLYGEGNVDKTMEISTRCGQDSDCNPSNAVAVLGIINGLSGLPVQYREAVESMGDSLFIHTPYSFNKAVERTLYYAEQIAVANGGKATPQHISIKTQEPVAIRMEDAFPKLILDKRVGIAEPKMWNTKGVWTKSKDNRSISTNKPKAEIRFTFDGTGASIEGCWVKEGGLADVYVDGKYERTIDCYYHYANQEHWGVNIFHILNLPMGTHTIDIKVKGEKNPRSEDAYIRITGAVVYKNGDKQSDYTKFSFE